MTGLDASLAIGQGRRVVLACAGAGTAALAALQSTPGCSRLLLEAVVPYGHLSLDRWLGELLKSHASAEAARAMAWRAWRRATELHHGLPGPVGVSCCAALATDRERKGQDRAHFGWCDGLNCRTWTMVLDKSLDRSGQELLVSQALLRLLAGPDSAALPNEDPAIVASPLTEVFSGSRLWARIELDGAIRSDPVPQLVVSGSFNPLHAGHVGLARAAEKVSGRRAVYELTAVNADKPPMEPAEVLWRSRQFHGVGALVVTRLSTFAAKADAMPGAIFVVGFDTAARVLESRFYPENTGGLKGALDHLRERCCSFLVAGRATEAGVFHGFDNLQVPAMAEGLFAPIPDSLFRLDLSSTDIRKKHKTC